MNVSIIPEVASTLSELGFPFVPNNTIHPAWFSQLKESRLLTKFEIKGEDCIIEFVNDVFRFKPFQLSERIVESYGELVITATYEPLFDKLTIEFVDPDNEEEVSLESIDFVGEQWVKYFTLMQQVSDYRNAIIKQLAAMKEGE